jgi:general stress protein 26
MLTHAHHDAVRCAYDVLRNAMEHREAAILTTASAEGVPHATWMATMTSLDFRRLLTLTSPDSRKVVNIRSNPSVEWLFTDRAKEQLVYLKGRASILDDVTLIKEAWKLIPHKERAFFLTSFNSGPGFAIIETQIQSVSYCVPAENRTEDIDPAMLAAQTGEAHARAREDDQSEAHAGPAHDPTDRPTETPYPT